MALGLYRRKGEKTPKANFVEHPLRFSSTFKYSDNFVLLPLFHCPHRPFMDADFIAANICTLVYREKLWIFSQYLVAAFLRSNAQSARLSIVHGWLGSQIYMLHRIYTYIQPQALSTLERHAQKSQWPDVRISNRLAESYIHRKALKISNLFLNRPSRTTGKKSKRLKQNFRWHTESFTTFLNIRASWKYENFQIDLFLKNHWKLWLSTKSTVY